MKLRSKDWFVRRTTGWKNKGRVERKKAGGEVFLCDQEYLGELVDV